MGKRTLKKNDSLTVKTQAICEEAKINTLMARPISGQEIEDRSFAIIEREMGSHPFNKDEWEVVRRLIHTSGDLSIANYVSVSNGAIDAGIAALKGLSPIYVDSRMIQAGISLERLRMVNPGYGPGFIHSYVANEDVIAESKSAGIPRSVLAVNKAKGIIDGALVAIGNSPTALLELNRLVIEEGVSPALVIAMPVGFVHVEESKEELSKLGAPHITLLGRRGGSPLAVSVIHALSILANGKSHKMARSESPGSRFDAVILLGHGSRVPGADRSMLLLADDLRSTGLYPRVETCNMSCFGPTFRETLRFCVRSGAKEILLLPYFLNEGLHMKLDIPSMMRKAAEEHPNIKLYLGKNLGYDQLLLELVKKRIREAESLSDVRELGLAGEEEYPLEPGELEFLPMLPKEAAEWKRGNTSHDLRSNTKKGVEV